MNALAPALGAPRPDLSAIEGVILLIDDGARASRDLDAAVFEALGWHVTRASVTDPRRSWTVLSPLSTAALPLPRVSKREGCARTLVPPGWDWGLGVKRGRAFGWCHNGRAQGDARLLWFEGMATTPALALTKVALHGQRALLLEAAPAAALARRCACACGWQGAFGALRPHRDSAALFCPDCDRQVS